MLAKVDAGHYLLSPKDLNTLDVLPQLIETGIRSFKIEGRMKRPEYVAVVTDHLPAGAIDSYLGPGQFRRCPQEGPGQHRTDLQPGLLPPALYGEKNRAGP